MGLKDYEGVLSGSRSFPANRIWEGKGANRVSKLKDSNDIHANFLSTQFHNFIGSLRSISVHGRPTGISIESILPPCVEKRLGSKRNSWNKSTCARHRVRFDARRVFRRGDRNYTRF